jgi:hypothetical protein
MIITPANLHDSLPMLISDNATFEKVKNDHPAILADLVTFKSNPNCTCRGKVMKFFSDQLQANPGCLDKYISNPTEFESNLSLIIQKRMENNFSGRVVTVPKGDQAWKDFVNSLNGKTFRNFSVYERENEVVVYFI